ncbi:MAG: TadE/TadG family type IV pilus assembly protein [Bryobacteraceae bacterium]
MKGLRPSIPRRRDCQGQSLVEFALVSLALVMLLFGVVEMCRLVLVYTTISNAARVGIRYATVHGFNNSASLSTVQGVVNGYLGAATVNTANATVNVCYAASLATYTACSSSAGSPGNPGTAVTISVSYPYNPLTGYFPINVNLSSTSQGVIAF